MFNDIREFVTKGLDDYLYSAIWGLRVFNERDLQAYVKVGLDNFLVQQDTGRLWSVRQEYQLGDKKHDLVILRDNDAAPVAVIEVKFWPQPMQSLRQCEEEKIHIDLERIHQAIKSFDTIRGGFVIMAHDSEEMYQPSKRAVSEAGYSNIWLSTINLRRRQDTHRKRQGYDQWREEFDKHGPQRSAA